MTVTSLVALDDVYDWLNIPANQQTKMAAKLQSVIDAATTFVEFQTGPIVPQTFTEVHSGNGPTIVLDNPPVLSVTSVLEYVGPTAYTLTQCELGTATGAYSFSLDDPAAGIICRRYTGGLAGDFMGGYRNIQIVYEGGAATVPADVRLATLEDIRGLYTQTQYGSPATVGGAGSVSDDAWNETAMNPIGAFPRLAALLQGPSRAPAIA